MSKVRRIMGVLATILTLGAAALASAQGMTLDARMSRHRWNSVGVTAARYRQRLDGFRAFAWCQR